MKKWIILVMAAMLLPSTTAAKEDYRQLYRQGVEYNKRGEFAKAIELYSRALALHPDSAEMLFVRGRAYRQNEQYDRAIEDLTRAIKLKPGYAEAYNHRGVVYIGKGMLKEAEEDFNKACSLGHQDGCKNLKKIKSR